MQVSSSQQGGYNGMNFQYGNRKGPSSCDKGHNRVWTHCAPKNYTIDTCFLKHVYPPGYNLKGKH